MTKPIATLEIDLNAIDPSRILIALGEPQHRLINNLKTGQATLTIVDRDQTTANAALAAYEAAGPTADDVRREASRRMQALVGARDAAHLELIVVNATREAVRLLRKGTQSWTSEEAARAAQLEAVDAAIEAIRQASNAMEADPPHDFANNRHWPAHP